MMTIHVTYWRCGAARLIDAWTIDDSGQMRTTRAVSLTSWQDAMRFTLIRLGADRPIKVDARRPTPSLTHQDARSGAIATRYDRIYGSNGIRASKPVWMRADY